MSGEVAPDKLNWILSDGASNVISASAVHDPLLTDSYDPDASLYADIEIVPPPNVPFSVIKCLRENRVLIS